MTETRPDGLIPISEIVDACAKCGSIAPPLHPGPVNRIAPGVVRDTLLCTGHLELDR
ncbi:hypothetical protein [Kitasatospora sp. NPDC094015]|uniref:hypothetical protein n=1 Tax=Kitasatospora sp. NPDC094015 TaxID=3155205 RepID=UPI00332179F4